MSERLTPDGWIDRLRTASRARLRVYIGAAPGVGKTCALLEDAHALRADGVDVVVGFVETHQRADTARLIGARGGAAAARRLQGDDARRDGSRRDPRARAAGLHRRRTGAHQRARQPPRQALRGRAALLERGISVLTAVNIQHLETLNDAVARVTGVRVRETVPDAILARADEVVNVDLTVEELQAGCAAARSTRPRRSSRRSRTSSGPAISRPCASCRCGRWPTTSAPRPRHSGSAKASTRRSCPIG